MSNKIMHQTTKLMEKEKKEEKKNRIPLAWACSSNEIIF